MTLFDYIKSAHLRTPPTPEFGALWTEGSGAPGANTSPFFLFYGDTTTNDVWFNPTRASDGWEIALAGSYIDTDDGRLKVTT